MATVRWLGSADSNEGVPWLVIGGTLKEADLVPLLRAAGSTDPGVVTLDLCDLEALTPGGCWTICRLADDLWATGCRLSVVFPEQGPVGEALRSSGTLQHPRLTAEVGARPASTS